MLRMGKLVQRSALVLTGVSIGAALWKSRSNTSTSENAEPLRRSVSDLEARLGSLENRSLQANQAKATSAETLSAVTSLQSTVASLTTRYDNRLANLETRVSDHETKLKDVPTLTQVVSTMEEMLASTMQGLDERLSEQVHSIETLKTTVKQSDELMERVLDSIYSLQSHVANGDKSEVPVAV
jgi:uncharacterized coiled-coil protein SlyX